MNTYKAFFNGKTLEIKADTSYQAQMKAIELFKPAKSKQHMVSVVLIAEDDQEVLVRLKYNVFSIVRRLNRFTR